MTFEPPTWDMTLVDCPYAKNDAVLVRRPGRQRTLHAEQIKLCNDCCNSELRPCVGLLGTTRLPAALWPSPGSSRGATRRGVGGVGLAWLVISFT
jgi:hypothetical protein